MIVFQQKQQASSLRATSAAEAIAARMSSRVKCGYASKVLTVQRPHCWLHLSCSDALTQRQDVRSPNTSNWERVVRSVPILQPFVLPQENARKGSVREKRPAPRILRTQPNCPFEPRNCFLHAPCVGKRISHGAMRLREGRIEIERCPASGQRLFRIHVGLGGPHGRSVRAVRQSSPGERSLVRLNKPLAAITGWRGPPVSRTSPA